MLPSHNEKGLSLIETLISLSLIAIITLSFTSYFLHSARATERTNTKFVAVHIARGVMDNIRYQPNTVYLPEQALPLQNHTTGEKYGYDLSTSNEAFDALATSTSNDDLTTYETIVNNRTYHIMIILTQTEEEAAINLVGVTVYVTTTNHNIQTSVEGYVSNE